MTLMVQSNLLMEHCNEFSAFMITLVAVCTLENDFLKCFMMIIYLSFCFTMQNYYSNFQQSNFQCMDQSKLESLHEHMFFIHSQTQYECM